MICLMLSHGQLDFVGITQNLTPFIPNVLVFIREYDRLAIMTFDLQKKRTNKMDVVPGEGVE